MSRFGKLPVEISEGVEVLIDKTKFTVKGPKGELVKPIHYSLKLVKKDSQILVEKKSESITAAKMQGTTRAHLLNMVKGVTQGWSKTLEIVGAGYRAEVSGENLNLTIGFSHPVIFKIPKGLSVKVEKLLVTIEGADKESVGQFTAKIRAARPPEPYKGTGIKYIEEHIQRKQGKQAAGTTE